MKRTAAGPGLRKVARDEGVDRRVFPWWFDYGTGQVVRSSDGQRWDARDVAPLNVAGEVDVAAVDRWVLAQAAVA